MGARADAGIFAIAPVGQIVLAFLAGAGVVLAATHLRTRNFDEAIRAALDEGESLFA